MRGKMTIVNLAHHLAMRANEIPTPLPSTGCNFINKVSNQFASINSRGRFHQGIQLELRIIKIKFFIVIIWLEKQWIKLVHSPWIRECLLCGADRDRDVSTVCLTMYLTRVVMHHISA